jgi:hypothetical protein
MYTCTCASAVKLSMLMHVIRRSLYTLHTSRYIFMLLALYIYSRYLVIAACSIYILYIPLYSIYSIYILYKPLYTTLYIYTLHTPIYYILYIYTLQTPIHYILSIYSTYPYILHTLYPLDPSLLRHVRLGNK